MTACWKSQSLTFTRGICILHETIRTVIAVLAKENCSGLCMAEETDANGSEAKKRKINKKKKTIKILHK